MAKRTAPAAPVEDEALDNAPEAPAEEAPVEETDAPVEEKASKKDGKSVSVLDASGNLIRVFSESVHGKEFADLAKQFVSKKGREGYSLK